MNADSYLESYLLEKGLINEEKLNLAKSLVNESRSLPTVLVEQGLIEEDKLLDILSEYFGIAPINLNYYTPDSEVLEIMPADLCKKLNVFPLFKLKNTLIVAIANPSDVHAMDEIRIKTGYGVDPVLALQKSIENAVSSFYGLEESVSDMLDDLNLVEEVEPDKNLSDNERELLDAAIDEPVVKLVNLLITQAIRDKASDIHINPEKNILRVRYRIDGVLQEMATPPKKMQAAIISRIKIMANMDIAERRVPQDGRIELKIDNRYIDLRVSSLPTVNGENIVMRILDKSNVTLGLDDLGFSERDYMLFNKIIQRPYGILLTSGPTGSGKTTTLYTALGVINSIDKNIITLEDPVEYNLPLIRQGQVNNRTGFTFAKGLKAILRQDPDVILVGEIRDYETASIAIQAAMTGHLVFSTLHTNDAPGCVTRLVDMGVQPFLIASTLILAIAQRLVRVICMGCKTEYQPDHVLIDEVMEGESLEGVKFFRGSGCKDCHNTGYKGRIGLYEMMEVTEKLQDAITHKVSDIELKRVAVEEGMNILRKDGIIKIKHGITTLEEVLRVTK